MKLSQAKNIVMASIDSQIQHATGRDAQRVIPYLIGGAGLGKTSVVQQIAEEREHGCYILSLAQQDAAELGWHYCTYRWQGRACHAALATQSHRDGFKYGSGLSVLG
jgi:ATP-dependent Lon protease